MGFTTSVEMDKIYLKFIGSIGIDTGKGFLKSKCVFRVY